MKIKKSEFYDKVLGCWMGKNIGGTLGTPDEWKRQLNNYSFYTHNIDGEPLPNDDLDLQIIWLKCLENNGINITARNLAECWLMFQIANYGEYGVAKANLRQGIMPPQSGILNNAKKHSCGAFIRSEIWACICPGRPDLAVKYAYEDAIVDHGDGEGTYAEFFTASAEAAAFVTDDIRKLIEIGLSYIPEDCGVAKAVRCVIDCYENKIPWQETRDVILEKFSGCVPDHLEFLCSERDREKGYDKGVLGYDVPSNIAIIVAGLLYGEGDFEKSLLITANMGEDTDCTAGFVGALYGIIMGAKNLPEKWVAPIGHNIKTMCCNLAHGAEYVPETVEELTERVIRQTMAVSSSKGGFNKEPTMDIFDEGETDLSDVKYEKLLFQNTELYKNREVMLNLTGPRYDTDWYSVAVDYEDNVLEADGEVRISLKFASTAWPLPQNLNIKWISDDLFVDKPETQVNVWVGTGMKTLDFRVSPTETQAQYRGVIEITAPGTSSFLYVPVYLTAFRREPDR